MSGDTTVGETVCVVTHPCLLELHRVACLPAVTVVAETSEEDEEISPVMEERRQGALRKLRTRWGEPDPPRKVVRITLVNPTPAAVVVPPGARVATLTRVKFAQNAESQVAALPPRLNREEKLQKVLKEFETDSLPLDPVVKEAFVKLVDKCLDAFASHDGDLGRTDLVFHEINTVDNCPLRQPPRRLPYGEHRDEVETAPGPRRELCGASFYLTMGEPRRDGQEEVRNHAHVRRLPSIECGDESRFFPDSTFGRDARSLLRCEDFLEYRSSDGVQPGTGPSGRY